MRTLLALLSLALPGVGAAASFTIPVTSKGVVNFDGELIGSHHFTGQNCAPSTGDVCGEHRSFFVFDLWQIPSRDHVASATLVVRLGRTSSAELNQPPFPHELALFDVDHLSAIPSFEDLGHGSHYGTYNIAQVQRTDGGRFLLFLLNQNGLDAISATAGSVFTMGAALTNIPADEHAYYIFEQGFQSPAAFILVETSEADPACELVIDDRPTADPPQYSTGDTLTLDAFRLANTGTQPITVDIRVWSKNPNGRVESLYGLYDVKLPAGYDKTAGPVTIGRIGPRTRRGLWQYNCRLTDPSTGEELAFDSKLLDVAE